MYILKVGGGDSVNLAGVADDLAAVDIPCVVVLGDPRRPCLALGPSDTDPDLGVGLRQRVLR